MKTRAVYSILLFPNAQEGLSSDLDVSLQPAAVSFRAFPPAPSPSLSNRNQLTLETGLPFRHLPWRLCFGQKAASL